METFLKKYIYFVDFFKKYDIIFLTVFHEAVKYKMRSSIGSLDLMLLFCFNTVKYSFMLEEIEK